MISILHYLSLFVKRLFKIDISTHMATSRSFELINLHVSSNNPNRLYVAQSVIIPPSRKSLYLCVHQRPTTANNETNKTLRALIEEL